MRPGRARAALAVFAALALASSMVRASPYHPFEAQTEVGGIAEFVTEANARAAQSFAPTANFTLTRVALYVQDRGNTDVLDVALVADAAGLPGTNVLATAANDTTDGAYEWANFTFAPSVDLVAGTPYWIVADSGGGSGQGYAWRHNATDLYVRGRAATASGNAWTAQAGDLAFAVYGWTPANLTLDLSADPPQAASGATIAYTVTLDNAGTEDATDLWVNGTMDSRLRFDRLVGPGNATSSGQVVSVRLAAVPQGTTSFDVLAVAGTLLSDRASFPFQVTAEYTDGGGRQALASSVLVEARAPRVVVTVGCSSSNVRAGGLLTFDVVAENEGREIARHAWLNQTLHHALAYLNDTSGVPPSLVDDRQSWHLRDLAPGESSFSVTVQVVPGTVVDTVITHQIAVEFTDSLGHGSVRARSNTIWLRVVAAAGESQAGNPWLWGSFLISATIVAGSYLAIVRRRLRTEELFLIHHSGVLLVHMSKTMKPDEDSDILSGMFTAILNFVKDAFQYDPHQELHGLDLGPNRVFVRKGAITYLAVVHSGKPRRWIGRAAAEAVAEIESEYGEVLRDWDGDVRALAGVRDILKDHFLSPTGSSRIIRRRRDRFDNAERRPNL